MSIPQKTFSERIFRIYKDLTRRYLEALTHRLILIVYIVSSALVWGVLWMVYLFWLREEWMAAFLGITGMSLVATSWWFSHITAYYVSEEGMGYWLAFKATVFLVLMKMSFLPVIGSIFERLLSTSIEKVDEKSPQAQCELKDEQI